MQKSRQLVAEGVVVRARRLQNSVNGNPRYSVTLETEDGTRITARTHHDASLSYKYTFTSLEGRPLQITYTASGALNDAVVLDGDPA